MFILPKFAEGVPKYLENVITSDMKLNDSKLKELEDRNKLRSAVFKWNNSVLALTFCNWSYATARRKQLKALKLPLDDDLNEGTRIDDDDAPPPPPLLKRAPTSMWVEKGISKHGFMPGRVGLTNFGNTCYFNSCTQALSNTPVVSHYLRNLKTPSSKDKAVEEQLSHLLTMSKLLRNLWDGSKGA